MNFSLFISQLCSSFSFLLRVLSRRTLSNLLKIVCVFGFRRASLVFHGQLSLFWIHRGMSMGNSLLARLLLRLRISLFISILAYFLEKLLLICHLFIHRLFLFFKDLDVSLLLLYQPLCIQFLLLAQAIWVFFFIRSLFFLNLWKSFKTVLLDWKSFNRNIICRWRRWKLSQIQTTAWNS